jgi:hypothetical protein
MPQRLKLSTMTKKVLKMSRCGQFESLWTVLVVVA